MVWHESPFFLTKLLSSSDLVLQNKLFNSLNVWCSKSWTLLRYVLCNVPLIRVLCNLERNGGSIVSGLTQYVCFSTVQNFQSRRKAFNSVYHCISNHVSLRFFSGKIKNKKVDFSGEIAQVFDQISFKILNTVSAINSVVIQWEWHIKNHIEIQYELLPLKLFETTFLDCFGLNWNVAEECWNGAGAKFQFQK